MSYPPSLDSLGELYPGFTAHKMMLRAWRGDADELWRRAFLRLSRTNDFYQRSDEDIARETMRILLDVMPTGPRKADRRKITRK